MNPIYAQSPLITAVHYLPILTTICSVVFATVLFRRYRARGGGPHLFWWGLGMVTYGLGTFTESFTTLFGWHPVIFKLWYVTGAFLGGYPLAQGSIYLLARRSFADWSARIVSTLIVIGAILVALSPLDLSAVEPHRLSGKALAWHQVRLMTPFINLYSLVFLAGGAALSAYRYRREVEARDRYVGNILIAIGALLPGIGGTFTRFGFVEALYVTELIGLLMIFFGYRRCVRVPPPASVLRPVSAAVALVLALVAAQPASAEQPNPSNDTGAQTQSSTQASSTAQDTSAPDEKKQPTKETPSASFFSATTVTATGSERDAFQVATPVTVVTRQEIERQQPDNAADLLREQPGVDVNGVGPNQARPVIRGQRGLRVLFLEDGLRLNNPRRQTDFGEISGLIDLDSVSSVEVVRGPASVLYGSDAIGGVLNLVTGPPRFADGRRSGGGVQLRYGSAAEEKVGSAQLGGIGERFDYQLGAMTRDTSDYQAPAGRFGRIDLPRSAPVHDTGLNDDSVWGSFGVNLNDRHSLRLRLNRYRADQTGFGFVDPSAYGVTEDTSIRILYPFQDFDRWALYYLGSALQSPVADSIDAKAYHQRNQRTLVNQIGINIGPIFPGAPDSGIDIDTRNFTRLSTSGLRLEAIKGIGTRHLVTWGAEGYRDDSHNTDFSTTTTSIRFPFPPFEATDVSTDAVANAPNAENSSWGVFAQDEWTASDVVRLTGGLRYQKVRTKAKSTPGWQTAGLDFDDDALVGSLTATWQLMPELNLLASYGTAFRAPSIIERLFNGITPEGSGYQILNPDLRSEKSHNVDLGLKYRRDNAYLELVGFRTEISGGIIQYFLSPADVAALPADVQTAIEQAHVDFVVQQRNSERLRYEGIELAFGYRTRFGLTVGGNVSHLDASRLDSKNPPTGDTFGDKYVGYARWEPQRHPIWLEYRVRHNASTPANLDPNSPVPPVGRTLPAFTVHTLAAGGTLFERGRFRHEIRLAVDNLTDALYAEFSNATFFRPEPGRSFSASYRLSY